MNSGREENKPKLNASTPLQQYREIMLALAERPADRPAPSADAKLSAVRRAVVPFLAGYDQPSSEFEPYKVARAAARFSLETFKVAPGSSLLTSHR